MTLLSVYLEEELPLMMDKGICLNIVGEIEGLSEKTPKSNSRCHSKNST